MNRIRTDFDRQTGRWCCHTSAVLCVCGGLSVSSCWRDQMLEFMSTYFISSCLVFKM